MNDQINNIPPVPDHTPIRRGDPVTDKGSTIAAAWSRWFLAVRNKVNAINESLVTLAKVTGSGLLVQSGGNWVLRSISGGTGIGVVGGDGSSDVVISIKNTTVVPGTYGNEKLITLTVDQQGRLTSVTDGATVWTQPTSVDTAAVGGAASALPALPAGYLNTTIIISGVPTSVKIPYYG